MPVLMGPERLLEAASLARSLGISALQEPGDFEDPIGAGGRDGHHVMIQHHESQPAVTVQRELMMETNNGHLFPRLQPMIAWISKRERFPDNISMRGFERIQEGPD